MVSYDGDDDYGSSEDSDVLVVERAETALTLSLTPTKIEANGVTKIVATLTEAGSDGYPLSREPLIVSVGGTVVTAPGGKDTDTLGRVSLSFTGMVPGSHTVRVDYAGSDELESASASETLTVKGERTQISVSYSPSALYPTQAVAITGKIRKAGWLGTSIKGKRLSLHVNGSYVDSGISDESGEADWSFTPKTAIDHDAVVSFSGDTSYSASSGKESLEVKRVPTVMILKLSDDDALSSETVTITATLKHKKFGPFNDTPISGKTITIARNGTTVVSDKTNASGQLTAKVNTSSDALSEGDHKIVAFLSKDTTHEYAADEDTLTIEKKATSLSIGLDDSSPYVSETVKITGTLKKDLNALGLGGTGYANQTITIKIGSLTKTATTNTSGDYSYSLTVAAGGEFDVTASFSGDTVYKSITSSKKTMTVTRVPTTMSVKASPDDTYPTDKVTITATLKHKKLGPFNDTPISGKTITIALNGTTVVSDKTNASGQLTAKVNTSSDALSEGDHKIVAFLSKDTTHEYAADEDTLTIEKKATSLSIGLDDSSPYVSETVKITGTLKKDLNALGLGGTGYANQTITIKIGSLTKTATTNTSGDYSYSLTVAAGGEFDVTASFSGDTVYKSITSSKKTMTVTRVPTTMSVKASPDDTYPTDKVTITATLKHKKLGPFNDTPISGKTITIALNGTTVVSDKTNASGQLTAKVNTSSDALSEGDHKIVAFLSKDTTHEYAADEDTLTIEKKATSLSIGLDDSSPYVWRPWRSPGR